jgi:hypothetical protein
VSLEQSNVEKRVEVVVVEGRVGGGGGSWRGALGELFFIMK